MSEIENILAKLDPKTRKRVQQASETTIEKQLTPSLGLNTALRGGLGYGRQSLIFGNKSAGKSSLCLQMVGMAQREGKVCAWIDSEKAYDNEWAKSLGVDTDSLIHSPVATIEDMAAVGTQLMTAGVDLIVVDSISSFLSSAYFEKDGRELKELGDTKQIGSDARDMANAVKMLNFVNENTALVLISQLRNKITTYGASHEPTGGFAVKFFSSTIVQLWSSDREAEQITGEVFSGDKVFKQPVGRPVKWTVRFNKLGPPNQVGEYDFYYDGAHIGVDSVGEVLDVGEKLGLVVKSGSWFTIYGEQFQGKRKAVEWLRDNPEALAKITQEINGS